MTRETESNAYSHCLQGQVGPALQALESNEAKLRPKGRKLLLGLRKRFQEREIYLRLSVRDKFVRDVIRSYREYYTEALTESVSLERAEESLRQALMAILDSDQSVPANQVDPAQVQDAVCAALRNRGLKCLAGRIMPHLHIHIWSEEEVRTYEVDLPGGRRKTTVRFLSGFLEQGWSHYATLGRYYAGGWADRHEVTCVRKAFDLDSEGFRVSLLAHESQHQSDYEEFPELTGMDLEYRAKLVEISLASRPNQLAERFRSRASDNQSSPHAFSAFVVIQDLRKALGANSQIDSAWKPTSAPRLRSIAEDLLRAHSAALREAGAATVESMIDRPEWL